MLKHANVIIREALENTDAKYWETLCRTRSGIDPLCEGSRFPRFSHTDIDRCIRKLMWEPYTHVNIEPPATGFIAREFPGELGVTRLADVPDNAILTFSDPKQTGRLEVVWEDAPKNARPRVSFVVLLVGPNPFGNDKGGNAVYTFFPGDPIKPSAIATASGQHGMPISKDSAYWLGYEWVKLK